MQTERLTDEDGRMEWIEWAKTIAKSRRTFKSEEDNDRGRSVSGDNGTFLVQGDLHERSSWHWWKSIVKCRMAFVEIFTQLFFGTCAVCGKESPPCEPEISPSRASLAT